MLGEMVVSARLLGFLLAALMLDASAAIGQTRARQQDSPPPSPGCLIKGNVSVATGERIYHRPVVATMRVPRLIQHAANAGSVVRRRHGPPVGGGRKSAEAKRRRRGLAGGAGVSVLSPSRRR
jgi:hypothetical protein